MSFSEAEEKQLISMVAKHPVIYDPSHDEYRNLSVTYNAWKAIGNKLNKNSEQCKKKWKHLRDSYIRFRKKHKSFAGLVLAKTCKFKRHHKLSFLDGVPQQKSGDSSTPASPQQHSDSERDSFDEEDDSTNEDEYIDFDTLDEQQDSSTDANKNESSDEAEAKPKANRVKRRYSEDSAGRDERISVKKRKFDDVDLFCHHIGEVLRNLPPVNKAEAKKHLYAVLSEYEITAARKSGSNYL